MTKIGIKSKKPPILKEQYFVREAKILKNKKMIITLASVAGGVAALGIGGMAIWNSKQLRTMRAVKRTEKILYKAGAVLQTLSEVV